MKLVDMELSDSDNVQEKIYKLNDPIWDKRWTAEKTYSQQMQDVLEPLPEKEKK